MSDTNVGRGAEGLPCPVCKVALVMSEKQGIEIDYCPQCRGVWLDRGELDKIIERGMSEEARYARPERGGAPQQQFSPSQQPPDPQGGYGSGHGGFGSGHGGFGSGHGGGHGGYGRRRGFLGGLFD